MHVHAFNVLKTGFLHTISVRTKSVSHLQNEKCLSLAFKSGFQPANQKNPATRQMRARLVSDSERNSELVLCRMPKRKVSFPCGHRFLAGRPAKYGHYVRVCLWFPAKRIGIRFSPPVTNSSASTRER